MVSFGMREALETANRQALRAQWEDAASSYARVLDRLHGSREPILLDPIRGLREALLGLAVLHDCGDEVGPEIRALALDGAPPALVRLREELAARCAVPELGKVGFVSAFPAAANDTPGHKVDLWTVVCHNRRTISHGDVHIVLPATPSFSFVIEVAGDALRCEQAAPQMAYAHAHLAHSRVEVILASDRRNGLLSHAGVAALLAAGTHYARALLVCPDYAWTVAHLGELYRTIANEWPGSWKAPREGDHLGDDYIKPLVCFDEAIRLYNKTTPDNPAAAWALAHFGATIIHLFNDIRPRLGAGLPRATAELCQRWFGEHADRRPELALIDKCSAALSKALQMTGEYPWARDYLRNAEVIGSALLGCIGEDREDSPSITTYQR